LENFSKEPSIYKKKFLVKEKTKLKKNLDKQQEKGVEAFLCPGDEYTF